MGQSFTDYEASHITPQLTLIKKLKAILDYLEDASEFTTKLYKHTLTISAGIKLFIVSTTSDEYDTDTLSSDIDNGKIISSNISSSSAKSTVDIYMNSSDTIAIKFYIFGGTLTTTTLSTFTDSVEEL